MRPQADKRKFILKFPHRFTPNTDLIDIPCGWANLVLQFILELDIMESDARIVQICNKMGGLRIDLISKDVASHNLACDFFYLGYEICECCGANEDVQMSEGGYICPLCPKCMSKREELGF